MTTTTKTEIRVAFTGIPVVIGSVQINADERAAINVMRELGVLGNWVHRLAEDGKTVRFEVTLRVADRGEADVWIRALRAGWRSIGAARGHVVTEVTV